MAIGATFGVAKRATVVPVQVLDCDGSGRVSGVIDGLQWAMRDAAQHGGNAVAVMSLNGGHSHILNFAVESAIANGLVTVTAAGNDAQDACLTSPASTYNAISVGATTTTVTNQFPLHALMDRHTCAF